MKQSYCEIFCFNIIVNTCRYNQVTAIEYKYISYLLNQIQNEINPMVLDLNNRSFSNYNIPLKGLFSSYTFIYSLPNTPHIQKTVLPHTHTTPQNVPSLLLIITSHISSSSSTCVSDLFKQVYLTTLERDSEEKGKQNTVFTRWYSYYEYTA